jgi:hypothetical protein
MTRRLFRDTARAESHHPGQAKPAVGYLDVRDAHCSLAFPAEKSPGGTLGEIFSIRLEALLTNNDRGQSPEDPQLKLTERHSYARLEA